MAVRRAAIRSVTDSRGRATVLTWAGLRYTSSTGDSGSAESVARHRDRSVIVTTTSVFGSGGSVRIEGSNDGGVSWATLHDPSGAVLNITSSAEAHAILEAVEFIRPRVTAGDNTTNIAIDCFVGGGQ